LHVSPNLIPTTNHPLTPPFSGIVESQEVPPGSHPATPRFLQSLLATAIYLSIPSVASQALALIFKTIGPNTVLQYLNFACGNSVSCDKEDVIEEPQAAVGLENVAQLLDLHEVEFVPSVRPQTSNFSRDFKSGYLDGSDRNSSGLSTASSGESTTGGFDHSSHENLSTSHHYGAVSDKIGEACVCWLTRWATDMLQLEADGDVSVGSGTRTRARSLDASKIAVVLSDKTTSIKPPVIWGRGGLSAKWAAAIISADTLFVKNEKERYNFARSVVALRRSDRILEDEESFWAEMFEQGIYYSNMVSPSSDTFVYHPVDQISRLSRICYIFPKISARSPEDLMFRYRLFKPPIGHNPFCVTTYQIGQAYLLQVPLPRLPRETRN
jgi:hypothetical protein